MRRGGDIELALGWYINVLRSACKRCQEISNYKAKR